MLGNQCIMYVLIIVQQITCLNSLPGLCTCTPSTSTVPRQSENGSSLEHGYSPPSTNTVMILKRASAVQASITGSTGASFQIFLPFSNGNFFAQLLQARIRERNEKVCETPALDNTGFLLRDGSVHPSCLPASQVGAF